MLGTEAEQGKGSLFPILVQKGYVHMALVGRENKKSERTIDIMHLSAFKPEGTLKYCSRKEKLLRLACSLSAISSLCFPKAGSWVNRCCQLPAAAPGKLPPPPCQSTSAHPGAGRDKLPTPTGTGSQFHLSWLL